MAVVIRKKAFSEDTKSFGLRKKLHKPEFKDKFSGWDYSEWSSCVIYAYMWTKPTGKTEGEGRKKKDIKYYVGIDAKNGHDGKEYYEVSAVIGHSDLASENCDSFDEAVKLAESYVKDIDGGKYKDKL